MKEHPIIISTQLIPAILEGRKTQTRRVIKPQPSKYTDCKDSQGRLKYPSLLKNLLEHCPYGQVGNRLWVKETWFAEKQYDNLKPKDIPITSLIGYLATDIKPDWAGETRSSRFIPLWASRITLEITGVRVERLQEIKVEDTRAEGTAINYRAPLMEFRNLWDSLNAKRGYGWETNCWVWVIKFRRLTGGEHTK